MRRILMVGLLIIGLLGVSDGVYGKDKKTVKEKFAKKVLIVQFEIFTKEADKYEFNHSLFTAIIKNLSEIKRGQFYVAKFEFDDYYYGVEVRPSGLSKDEEVIGLLLIAGQFISGSYGSVFNSALSLELKPDMDVNYFVSSPARYGINILLVHDDDFRIEHFLRMSHRLIKMKLEENE